MTTTATPDLAQCEREPIHLPGSIQPSGVLLAVNGPAHTVTQVSETCDAVLGVSPSQLLGGAVASAAQRLRPALAKRLPPTSG